MSTLSAWMVRTVGLVALGATLAAAALSAGSGSEGASCEKFGTAVEWAASSAAAKKAAREQGKLVFLMHVSGNFARPEFT